MRIRVLGPLLVGEPPTTPSPRDRVVLSALVARDGRACTPDELAEAVWHGARPATWTKVIQGSVLRLRRSLGAPAIEHGGSGYRLTLPRTEIDSVAFEDLLARGRRLTAVGEPARALVAFDEALALWRGEPLPDLDGWGHAAGVREHLETVHDEVEEERLAAAVAAGRAAQSVDAAQALVRESPYRERRWELLALSLYASGRQAEALEVVGRARRVLREELGLDPGPGLAELEQSILGQDPRLPGARDRHASDTCPYPGLTPFGPEDHDLFVGRETDVVTCLRRLDEQPLLLVVGPSGSGKSSVARAGLVPALRAAGRDVVVVVPGPDGPDDLRRARENAVPGTALVVDQLEDLAAVAEAQRTPYLDAVADWTGTGPVVLAVRSDRLEVVSTSPRLSRLAGRGLYLLPRLGPTELRRAIVEPADRVGLFVEPGLVDLLLRDLGERPGSLPLLSHALRQTWLAREGDVMTVDGYLATGGIAQAVARTADAVYDGLDASHQRAVRGLLLRLVSLTPDGSPVSTRLATGPRTESELLEVIEALAGHRLVTVEDGEVALSHESLARAWPRLRQWLADDVDGRRLLEHLRVAAAGWSATGRPDAELYRGARLTAALEWREASGPVLTEDEQDFLAASTARDDDERRAERQLLTRQHRQNRRLRVLLALTAGLLVAAVVAGTMAVGARREAQQSADELVAARLGDLALREPRADTALLAARQGVELADTPQTSADLLRTVDAFSDIRSVRDVGVTGWIGSQQHLSPSGDRLLAVLDEGVVLVDPATGRRIPDGRPLVAGGFEAMLYPLGFSADGATAWTARALGDPGDADRPCAVQRFVASDGTSLGAPERVPGSRCSDFWEMDRLRISPDGRTLVSSSLSDVRVWTRESSRWTGPRSLTVPGLTAGERTAREGTFSADGSRVSLLVEVSGTPPWYRFRYLPVVVDLRRMELLLPAEPSTDTSRAALSPDGSTEAVGRFDGTVELRALDRGSGRVVDSVGRSAVTALQWSGSTRLLVGRADGTVDVVDTAGPALVTTLAGHGTSVVAIVDGAAAGHRDGEAGIVSLDEDGVAVVRTPATDTLLGARRPVTRPHSVAVVPGGPVAVGEEGGRVSLYRQSDLAEVGALRLGPGTAPLAAGTDVAARRRVSALAALPDGSGVVAGDRSGTLTRWSWPGRSVVWSHDDAPAAFLAVSPDGRFVVTAEFDTAPDDVSPDGYPLASRVRIWDAATGEQQATIDTGDHKPRAIAIAPDSTTAVVGFFDEGLTVLDLARGTVRSVVPGDADALAFSLDGSELVVLGWDGTGRVLETSGFSETGTFPTYAAGYAHLLPTPDGRMFLAGPVSVSVWDSASHRRLVPSLSMVGDGTNDALFLAQDPRTRVLVVGTQHSLALLTLDEQAWRALPCRTTGRTLTEDEWRRLVPDHAYDPACSARGG